MIHHYKPQSTIVRPGLWTKIHLIVKPGLLAGINVEEGSLDTGLVMSKKSSYSNLECLPGVGQWVLQVWQCHIRRVWIVGKIVNTAWG